MSPVVITHPHLPSVTEGMSIRDRLNRPPSVLDGHHPRARGQRQFPACRGGLQRSRVDLHPRRARARERQVSRTRHARRGADHRRADHESADLERMLALRGADREREREQREGDRPGKGAHWPSKVGTTPPFYRTASKAASPGDGRPGGSIEAGKISRTSGSQTSGSPPLTVVPRPPNFQWSCATHSRCCSSRSAPPACAIPPPERWS